MSAYLYPTVQEFKDYFFRDFPYGVTLEEVTDADISKAMAEARFNFAGETLASSQEEYSMLYLYLTAHYLVMDLRASSQGISGKFAWLTSSKSVGSVSESYAIPDRILANPELAYYAETLYGTKYLSLLLPMLGGQVMIALGRTLP